MILIRLSRNLNNMSMFLSLSSKDIVILSVFLIAGEKLFSFLGYSSLGFTPALLALLVLIPIRMKYRDKIIIDYLSNLIKGGRYKW